MKEKSLQDIIRESAGINKIPIIGQTTTSSWPRCLLCNQEVDAVRLENINNHGCELVANHHGSEDSVRITWKVPAQSNTNNPLDDPNLGWQVKRAQADTNFFDPRHLENSSGK